ncbi:MAG: C10 family peptidase [Prevotella sp.]|nr:C10 family peptidase [Prevotella sp.]
MKRIHILILFAILLTSISCNDGLENSLPFQVNNTSNPIIEEISVRSLDEVNNIVSHYCEHNASIKRNKRHISGNNNSPEIQVFRRRDAINASLISYEDSINFPDTLVYAANIGDGTILIPAYATAPEVVAELEDNNFTFSGFVNRDIDENPMNLILSRMIDIECWNAPDGHEPVTWQPNPLWELEEEVLPKVQVEWKQQGVFARYCPSNYAGCVAVATAQAFTVTRHTNNFNGLPLNYDNMILFKNIDYEYYYPEICDTVARFIHLIGIAVDMDYGDDGSSADTEDAVPLFTRNGTMIMEEGPQYIRSTLRDYPNGIVLACSRTKSDFLGLWERGKGHAYIIDGYKKYYDNYDMIHVNMGQWNVPNGYYMEHLLNPQFLTTAPKKYNHEFHFFCIHP